MVKKNNHLSEVKFKEYGCKENIFGSDHRPVYLNFEVNLKLTHILDPQCFINPKVTD